MEKLFEIANRIAKLEEERKSLAQTLRNQEFTLADSLEKDLFCKAQKIPLNCDVGAVDGGLLAQEFHGFDLLLVRAVGVVFKYQDSTVKSYKYHPHAIVEPELDTLSALDSHDFLVHKGLTRLKKELSTAIELVEKHLPNYLLLDGSIAPQISDKPGEDSELRSLYNEVIHKFIQLYSTCEKNNVTLIGIIKDSRAKRFIESLSNVLNAADTSILSQSNDTSFINFLLNEGERTFAFSYTKDTKNHQALKELRDWGSKINVFYLKPVINDRPLRVEFLVGAKTYDEIASLVYTLSGINKSYAYPAILIEADLRAALDRREMDRVYRQLFTRTGMRSSVMKLRRDNRPFR
ncbi:DNA double-strand break repair nuclease NurA [Candidatus Micrarchaeota archaeon]|nr:DNA double-strand break repair nuclease NurA [Candidatus Micrarchaeota archaeon]